MKSAYTHVLILYWRNHIPILNSYHPWSLHITVYSCNVFLKRYPQSSSWTHPPISCQENVKPVKAEWQLLKTLGRRIFSKRLKVLCKPKQNMFEEVDIGFRLMEGRILWSLRANLHRMTFTNGSSWPLIIAPWRGRTKPHRNMWIIFNQNWSISYFEILGRCWLHWAIETQVKTCNFQGKTWVWYMLPFHKISKLTYFRGLLE